MLAERKTWQATTGRGDETELAVALALVRAGKKLLRPLSSATRYDLLVDNEDGWTIPRWRGRHSAALAKGQRMRENGHIPTMLWARSRCLVGGSPR